MAEETLHSLIERVSAAVGTVSESCEIILVDDGSTDQSWEIIKTLAGNQPLVTGLRLSRNFGQHNAITAGLDQSQGEWVVVMDCDLQDLPEEIPGLFRKASEGYDIVLAARRNRKDAWINQLQAKIFSRVLGYLTGTRPDSSVGNFGLYHRKVIDAIGKMREPVRFFPTLVTWVGFKTVTIQAEHAGRPSGTSNYNFRKRARLALNILLSNSEKPLKLLIKGGLLMAAISLISGVLLLIHLLNTSSVVAGFMSLLMFLGFFTGLGLSAIGMVGLYVGKTFEGVKGRPIYLIDQKTG